MADKQAPHIEQALAEVAGATNEEQTKAARKRLDATGYEDPAKARRAAAADSGDADDEARRRRAPQDRRAPGKHTS